MTIKGKTPDEIMLNLLIESIINRAETVFDKCGNSVHVSDIKIDHLYSSDWYEATEEGESFTLKVNTTFISTKILDALKEEFRADDIMFSFEIDRQHTISHFGVPDFQIVWVFRLKF